MSDTSLIASIRQLPIPFEHNENTTIVNSVLGSLHTSLFDLVLGASPVRSEQILREFVGPYTDFTETADSLRERPWEVQKKVITSLRRTMRRLREKMEIVITELDADTLMSNPKLSGAHFIVAFVPQNRDHIAKPKLCFTPFIFDKLKEAETEAEAEHIILGICVAWFREMGTLLSRFLRVDKGTAVSLDDKLEETMMQGMSERWNLWDIGVCGGLVSLAFADVLVKDVFSVPSRRLVVKFPDSEGSGRVVRDQHVSDTLRGILGEDIYVDDLSVPFFSFSEAHTVDPHSYAYDKMRSQARRLTLSTDMFEHPTARINFNRQPKIQTPSTPKTDTFAESRSAYLETPAANARRTTHTHAPLAIDHNSWNSRFSSDKPRRKSGLGKPTEGSS